MQVGLEEGPCPRGMLASHHIHVLFVYQMLRYESLSSGPESRSPQVILLKGNGTCFGVGWPQPRHSANCEVERTYRSGKWVEQKEHIVLQESWETLESGSRV